MRGALILSRMVLPPFLFFVQMCGFFSSGFDFDFAFGFGFLVTKHERLRFILQTFLLLSFPRSFG